ncbi:hypothetical protein Tco_0660729 [Tanacetum coccineum]
MGQDVRSARKAAKSEVQSSLKPSPVFGDAATKRPLKITFKRKQNPLHAKPKVISKLKSPTKHAPKPEVKSKLKSPAKAKPSPPPRNPILRAAKHAPPPANPKPKAPKLKASDVTESDQGDGSGSEEGDGSGSEEEGDEEEDEEEGDEEEDEEECDEEEDEENGDEEEDEGEDEEDAIVKDEEYEEEEENVSEEEEEEEEEDVKVKGNKRGRKGKGEVVMSKGKKIKVEDKEVEEKKRKKDSEPSSSEDEKPLKKKTKGGKKGKGPSKPTKKVLSDNHIRREKFLSDYPPLLSRTVPSSFFHAIRDAKVNMKRFMEDIGFSAFHSVNIDMLPNRSKFVVKRLLIIKPYNFTLKQESSRREDDEFLTSYLFANVMVKKTHEGIGKSLVVRRIHEDTNIAELTGVIFISPCPAISHDPNTDSDIYNGSIAFLIIICEMIEEKLSSISKEKAEVETLLRDANKEFPNDDNVKQLFEQYKGFFKETVLLEEAKAQKAPQNVKPKPAAVNTKEAAEKPKPAENVKELAEKAKELAEKSQKAPQNVKPKPAAVKTKEAAEKPKPAAENVKELAEKPKEPAGDDYQVVRAATVMKAEDRKEFEVESFTQWIEGNIDWVGEVRETSLIEKPVKPVNSPYMCRRIDVTARCKRVEFVLGNSLFAMDGDKYETVFQSLGGYRDLSSIVRVFAMIHMENYVGDAPKNWEFGLCEESDEQISMLQRLRYMIATKIMLHQFNAVSNKMFDFAFTFETNNTEQARVSMIVDAIKNMNNRDPPKQVKETDTANVVVGVKEAVDQVKEKGRQKK